MSKITIKQEKFCLEYLKDGNASRAYREAYNASKMKEASINVNASKLLKYTKIALRLKELRKETTTKAILSIEERKEILSNIAKNVAFDKEGNSNYNDARGAIDLLNKMDGVYVVKNQTEVSGVMTIQIDPRVL